MFSRHYDYYNSWKKKRQDKVYIYVYLNLCYNKNVCVCGEGVEQLSSQGLPQVRILPLLSVVTNTDSVNKSDTQGSACIADTIVGCKIAA